MRLAIIGSRTLNIQNIADYLPEGVTEIVSGGTKHTIFLFEKLGKAVIIVKLS